MRDKTFSNMGKWVALYDVEIESGHYDVSVKGDFYNNTVINKLVQPTDYFEDLRANIEAVIYSEDIEGLYNVLTRKSILKELSVSDHFDYYYRINTDNGPIWFKMRIVYKNAEKKNVIIGVFNAAEEMAAKKLIEAQFATKTVLSEYLLKSFVTAYYTNIKNGEINFLHSAAGLEQWKNECSVAGKLVNHDYLVETYSEQNVHPEDREKFRENLDREHILRQLEVSDNVTFTYRDISEDTPIIYRCTIIRGADKDHMAIGFQDITDEVRKQEEHQKQIEEQKAKVEESQKLIESIAATYNIAYAVNLADDSFIQIRMDANIIGAGEVFKTFTEAKEFFFNILPDSDRELMRRELDYGTIRKRLAEKKSYNVEYRVPINGAIIWHEMNVTSIDAEHVAIGFVNRDLEITKKHLENKRYDEYFALYEVDIDSGMLKIVKVSPWYGTRKAGTALPYSFEIMKYAATLDEEPRKFFEQFANLEYVKKNLATDDKHTFSFRTENIEGRRWLDCTCYVTLRHSDGTPAMFTLGFSLLDQIGIYRQELQNRLTENMQLVGGLASGYDTLYYVNIDQHIFKPYSDKAQGTPEIQRLIKDGGDAFDNLRRYARSGLIHPEDSHLLEEMSAESFREKLAHSKKFSVRFRRNYNGEYRWNEMDVVKYEEIDEPANAVAVGFADRDVEVRAEQERQKQLEEARVAAEAASKAKTNFLFSMSHDIRTPMNAITGFTNMAIKHIGDKMKTLDCLYKIQKSGSMLLSLINSVLEVSRIESGKAMLEEQQGDVLYSFTNIEQTMQELAKTKDIKLSFGFGEIRDRYVYADFGRCMRIFVNVISNAIKYTPEGGCVKVKCEQIDDNVESSELRVQSSEKEDMRSKVKYVSSTAAEVNSQPSTLNPQLSTPRVARYRYTVADNGIGMSEEFQKHVFEQFSRENTATVSGIQGTGLGMAVVKSFVELMGGAVECRSKQGEGTTFTITLPFRLQEGSSYTDPVTGDVVTAATKSTTQKIVDFTGKNVLLVEDNELNREIAVEILEGEGMIIEEAENGAKAVEMVKQNGLDFYDFILMDVQMPVMNGYEATRAIRALEVKSKSEKGKSTTDTRTSELPGSQPSTLNSQRLSHIPVIALSANAFTEDKVASLEAGMDGHVAKPINVRELITVLGKFV